MPRLYDFRGCDIINVYVLLDGADGGSAGGGETA